jgi:hypothetical protein
MSVWLPLKVENTLPIIAYIAKFDAGVPAGSSIPNTLTVAEPPIRT